MYSNTSGLPKEEKVNAFIIFILRKVPAKANIPYKQANFGKDKNILMLQEWSI